MHAISGGNYEELYKTIPAWEEKTGATVEIVFKGNGFETDKRLVQDFAANTVDYDVCWDHTSFFSQYVKAGGLEPLDAYFTADDLADFIPRLMDAARKDGKLWLIPRHYDISLMQYNTDIVKKAPETWDEFKQIALEVTDAGKGIYGTQFAGKEEALSGRFYEVLTAEGGLLFDDKWEPTFNSAAGVKTATMFADLYKAKAMPADMTNYVWDDVAKNFANGTIGLYTEWPGWYSFFQDPKSSKVAGQVRLRPPADRRRQDPQRLGRRPRVLDHEGQQEQGSGCFPDQAFGQCRGSQDRSQDRSPGVPPERVRRGGCGSGQVNRCAG